MGFKSYVVEKSVLCAGSGLECPVLGTACKVVISNVDDGTTENKLSQLCGCKINDEVQIVLEKEEGDISHIIDTVCLKMKRNSQILCKVTILGDSVFMPNENISFIIHLISWDLHTVPIYKLEPDACFRLALYYKDTGTCLFKLTRTHIAAIFYSRAIKYLIIMINNCNNEDEKAKKVLSICHVNLAACLLKFKLYPEVIANCSDALLLEENNIKALYRRAVAYLSLNDLDNAESDISLGIKLDHNNSAFVKLQSDLKEKTAFMNAQLSERLKTLFA